MAIGLGWYDCVPARDVPRRDRDRVARERGLAQIRRRKDGRR